MPPAWLRFDRRTFPSGNVVLVAGARPVLVDTGFGADVEETEAFLRRSGVPPEALALIVSTHYHSDHAGGNHLLQERYGVPIAAHRWEADLVNRRDPEACGAAWLDQPVEPYRVDRPLSDGDLIEGGGVDLVVVHTPGHTLGHLSLHAPEEGVLICGDAVHRDDVSWVNFFREGVGSLRRAMESVERLGRLGARWACSGHGPPLEDPAASLEAAHARYERWLADPVRPAWHGIKRIFAYALMIRDGLARDRVEGYLLGSPWFRDFSVHVFDLAPEEFVGPLLAEMLRSGAAGWSGDRLVALTPHRPPPAGWLRAPGRPADWPDGPRVSPISPEP